MKLPDTARPTHNFKNDNYMSFHPFETIHSIMPFIRNVVSNINTYMLFEAQCRRNITAETTIIVYFKIPFTAASPHFQLVTYDIASRAGFKDA